MRDETCDVVLRGRSLKQPVLAITFAICVAFDFLFPSHAMYQAWQKLLPGFEWISWKSFFLGLIESYGYGWYFTLIWVPLYNVFARRASGRI